MQQGSKKELSHHGALCEKKRERKIQSSHGPRLQSRPRGHQDQASSHKSRLHPCPSQVNLCRPRLQAYLKTRMALWTSVPGPLENEASSQGPTHLIGPVSGLPPQSRSLGLLRLSSATVDPGWRHIPSGSASRNVSSDLSATAAQVDPGSLPDHQWTTTSRLLTVPTSQNLSLDWLEKQFSCQGQSTKMEEVTIISKVHTLPKCYTDHESLKNTIQPKEEKAPVDDSKEGEIYGLTKNSK